MLKTLHIEAIASRKSPTPINAAPPKPTIDLPKAVQDRARHPSAAFDAAAKDPSRHGATRNQFCETLRGCKWLPPGTHDAYRAGCKRQYAVNSAEHRTTALTISGTGAGVAQD
jgi:hypothetical protein